MKTKWETVIEVDSTNHIGQLSRARIPGGWIYKSHGTGVCFVPTPVPERYKGGEIIEAKFEEVPLQ